MRPWLVLLVVASASLACAGGPDPSPPLPVMPEEEGDEAPEVPVAAPPLKADCTVGMVGVLTGVPGLGSRGPQAATVAIRKGPRADARVFAQLDRRGLSNPEHDEPFCAGAACVHVTWDAGRHGLPVYSLPDSSGWALVGLGTGGSVVADGRCRKRGWVQVEEPLAVEPVGSLLDARPDAFVRAGMGGPLFDVVEGSPRGEVSAAAGDRPVRVKRVERVGDATWVEIDVLDRRPCEGTPSVMASGWMPLADSGGRLRMWYHPSC